MYPSYSPLFTLGLLADRGPVVDDATPIYFTFSTGKRDTVELRSFLYLDLADNRRHAPSHKRKCSLLSKSTSWTCATEVKSIHHMARSEKPMTTSPSPGPVVPARRRTSKESLRNIPSPKPAPSATLPDLPTAPKPRPLLALAPPSALKKRPASAVISPLSPTARVPRPASLRSESVSSHDRRMSRMDALACLEGRSRAPNRIPRASALRKNFMNFSDDEDEKATMHKSKVPSVPTTPVVEDVSAFADIEDEVDATSPCSRRPECADQARPARPARPARKRRSTIESWFPLKSFIDFKDDDLSWNWRSFIEIGGVA